MGSKPEILIKSFNRPFYLDRCLFSIEKYCKNYSAVKVLDDGTPEVYIQKIKMKYPWVEILRSSQSVEKKKAIEENLNGGAEIDGFKIPVDLWKNAVRKTTEYFIITEDDVWFTKEIDLGEFQSFMKDNKTDLLKLGNLGVSPNGENYEWGKEKIIYPHFDLIAWNKPLMKAFFYNNYKFYSLLYKLKIVDNFTFTKYYGLISILMGMYQKEYWLKLWENIDVQVDEKRQLLNASQYYRKNSNNKKLIAVLADEAMKTTFKSSATNSYHKYGNNFDVNRFNHILNKAWLRDEFDIIENFPRDFSDRDRKSVV